MTEPYRPLFNRKYLTALVWFCLIAILLLTSQGPSDAEYHPVSHNKNKTLYWMELDEQPISLSILLPTPAALGQPQQQLQQLYQFILEQRLRAQPNPTYSHKVVAHQDHLEVTLRWAAGIKTPDLRSLWQNLSSEVIAANWQNALNTIQARQYLDNQSVEQQLINQFFNRLSAAEGTANSSDVLVRLPQTYNSLFQTPRYTLSGHETGKLAPVIEQQLPQPEPAQTIATLPPTPAIQPPSLTVSQDQQYRLLLGGPIPPRSDERFIQYRLAVQVLQDLLAGYQDQHNMQFRLLWAALQDQGYQALLIRSAQNPLPLLPQLQQLADETLVKRSSEQLIEQWRHKMYDNEQQVNALNLIARYQLAPDTMESYADNLSNQDSDQIIKLVRDALASSQYLSLLQQPKH